MGQRSSRCKEAKKDLGRVHFHDGTPSHSFTCLVKAHPHPLGVVEETVGGEKETTRKEDNSKKKKRFRLWRWRSFCWRAGRKYSRKSSLVQSDVEAQGPGASAAHPGIIPDVHSFLQQVICSVENHNHQEPSTSDPEILLAAEEHLAVHSDVLQSLACSDNVAQTPVDTELNWCADIAQTLVHATSDWSIDVSQTPVRTTSDWSTDVSQTPVCTTSDWSTDVSQTPVCTTSDWSTDVSQTPVCTTSDWSTDVSQTPVCTTSDWSTDVSQTPVHGTPSDWSIDVSQTPLRTASDWSIDVFQTPVRTASDWSIDFSQTPVRTASDWSIDFSQTPVHTASDWSIDFSQTPVRTASDCSIDVFQTPVRTASDWSIDFSQTPVHTASDWRIDVFQTPVRTASDWSIDFSQTPVRGTPSDRSTDVIQSLVHTTFDWNANVTQTPVCTTSDWYIDVGQTTVSPTEISVSPLTRQLENNKNETVVINSCYYVISDMLGEGTFGTVYDGSRLLDGFKVAVKIVRKTEDFEYISIPNHPRPLPLEVALLTLANRGPRVPEIIQLLDWEDQHDYYIMVLEHPSPCEDLFGLTERYGGSIDEGLARIVMQQAAQAAYMCCRRGVLHRDIKLENLLINKETHEVKLIDFGCGDLLKKSAYKIFLGTDEYCPPEYEEKGEYNGKPATVWSLGVLLFALVNGDYPSTDDLHMINANNYSKVGLSKECCRLISSCLQREPEQRLRLSEILLHDWFKVTDVENLKTV